MIIRIFFLLILIFINGILASSELAYLSIDKFDLARKRDKKSKKILKVIENESKFLSTIQIGITLAGFLASAFASDTFTDILIAKGVSIINENFTENFLMIIITLILSYITLVFGELVPKKIARSNPLKVAKKTINIIDFISTIFYPLIYTLTISTNFICKILKIKEVDNKLTEKDIKKIIITGNHEGIIEEKEKEYILNIFEFNDKTANKIMTPKKDVIVMYTNDTKKNIIKKIQNSHFTRYPIIDQSKDKVIGFLNVKDLIYLYQNNKDINLKTLAHPVISFDKSEKIDDIFRIMQENKEIFSIIKDKKNEFLGILTIEDAIEEIVGQIADEYN